MALRSDRAFSGAYKLMELASSRWEALERKKLLVAFRTMMQARRRPSISSCPARLHQAGV